MLKVALVIRGQATVLGLTDTAALWVENDRFLICE